MIDRTAIDTIKGYFYQFDFTIAKLLELGADNDTIIIEGVEDVDISTPTEETAIQCKYYSKTEYNHSVIAKPIRLMLNHYEQVKRGTASKINYKLYGYFQSGHSKLSLPIDAMFLKTNFLTYTKKKRKYSHHTKLALDDSDLDKFISLLTIDILALEYQDQLSKIFKLLMFKFNCNAFEAEHFYYNNALKVVKDISVESNIADRKISQSNFLKKINFKQVLFNAWFIKFKGENKLFAEIRREYFTSLNVSPFERFFIIDIPSQNYVRSELKDLIFTISRKWSKLSAREPHPFCPYIYLHNISEQELLELKEEIFAEGFAFKDGFDFQGAAFNAKSISKPLGSGNQIRLKILNKIEHVSLTLNEISKTKEIYEFYNHNPIINITKASLIHVKIQYSKLIDIKKII